MKKLLLSVALMSSFAVFAQRAQKGDLQLNAGVVLPHQYADNIGLYAGLDYGIHPDITVGAEFRFGGKSDRLHDYDYKYNWLAIGFNGNYHFNTLIGIPNNWDFYAGATVGFNSFTYRNTDYPGWSDPHSSGVGVSAQVGGRYYFSNNFGVNAEVNAGSIFNGGKLGITYKF